MPEMKNSGIEWIGMIPSNWCTAKYKHFSKNRMGETILINDTVENGIPVYSATQDDKFLGYVENAKVILHNNDIVIPARGNSIGFAKIVHSDKATCTQTTICSTDIHDIEPKFLYYCCYGLKDYWFQYDGSAIPQITVSQVENNILALPPLSVQQSIANFLDQKCSEINSLSADIQSQIDVLEEYKKSVITEAVTKGLNPDVEMKDSGIEWIGMVPKHWDRGRIKDFCKITRGGSPRPIDNYLANENQKGYNWVRIGDTKKGYKFIDKTYLRIIPSGLSSTRLVKRGTLLLTNSMSFGEPYIMNVDGCIHDGWLAFYDYNNISKEFLYYVLMSDSCKTQFILSSAGAVVSNLNIDKVANTLIFVPSIEEQLCIASYLDNKCYQVDLAIADKKAQLETLAAYKKSLIYEYVTGKKEIPENV